MTQDLYKALGEAKCHELSIKSWRFCVMLELSEGRESAQVTTDFCSILRSAEPNIAHRLHCATNQRFV